MDILASYNLIIEASLIIILSFFFSELSRKTNVPSVLMLIILGIGLRFGLDSMGMGYLDFFPVLEILGIVGLIMIVLEAALELELRKDKLVPISKAMLIATLGLVISAWIAAMILEHFVPGMTTRQAWIYATPLSILSSAIIIPSVTGLQAVKKEFHIYESTFSDILGIMLFYFLVGPYEATGGGESIGGFFGTLFFTILISVLASYLIVVIFQNIRSQVKLFLLIAVLLLLYALGKQMHLSSLIIILIFGLLIANRDIFFQGRLSKFLHVEKAKEIYHGLHIVTLESSFVVRTFFFVIFGITISLASLADSTVVVISLLILASIYLIRWILLRIFMGANITPQWAIAPRGLITILLFYAIPVDAQVAAFEPGILLFVILFTGLIMTGAMIYDKRRHHRAIRVAQNQPVGYIQWQAPEVEPKGPGSTAGSK